MTRFHDRVKETTTTTGTGAITLSGAVSQFVSFSSRYQIGDLLTYCISGQTGTEWEVGRGYLTNTTTLLRDTVLESSNADTFVSFSAGTKDIFVTASSSYFNTDLGIDVAGFSGYHLP
jgi:hypothetical protein